MNREKTEIRIGLLGFGSMGRTHTWAVQNLPFFYGDLPFSAVTAGVCTTSYEKSERVARDFSIPKAVACDDVGRFRKLKTLVLSCAFNDKFAAQNNAMSVMGHFRDIVYLFLCQR